MTEFKGFDFPENPYSKFITDESSGETIVNQRHQDWNDGMIAGLRTGLRLMAFAVMQKPETIREILKGVKG